MEKLDCPLYERGCPVGRETCGDGENCETLRQYHKEQDMLNAVHAIRRHNGFDGIPGCVGGPDIGYKDRNQDDF